MRSPINIPALISSANPAVQIENGTAITTSTEVARVFSKPHNDVLKAIRLLISQLPEDRLGNFAQTVITRPNPSGGEPIKSPAYQLTRDGYTLLAMGFTGKKALAFKLAYIKAFNRMEEALHSPAPVLTTEGQAQDEFTLDITDARQIQSARAAALEYFDKAQKAVKTGAAWPEAGDLNEILRSVLASALHGRRWMVHFDHAGQMSLHPVASDALNLTLGEAARRIEAGDLAVSNEQLLLLAQASNARLLRCLAAPALARPAA